MEYRIIPKKKTFLSRLSPNTILIAINVLAYIVFSTLLLINSNFLNFIALKPSNILQGKFLWTFLTSMFMHAGFFHIFLNMLSLFFLGSLVQKILGAKRYVLLYLASGLFAGISFVLLSLIPLPFFSSDFNTFAVGSSGAIYGLIGMLMILTPNLPVYVMFIPIPIKMKYAAPGFLIALWLISLGANIPIGNTAHLGGFILGLGFGIYLKIKYKRKTKYLNKYFS